MQEREPTCVGEALKQEKWNQAMQAKVDAIEKNGPWKLLPRPQKQVVNIFKWVYKTKYQSDGSLDKQKAMLVAKG